MTLSYSRNWPKTMGPEYAGKPNYFVPKIYKSIWDYKKLADKYENPLSSYNDVYCEMYPKEPIVNIHDLHSKIHTFRQDSKDRWKVGMKIHPVINNRTKDRFQFAPVMEVKGIQKVEIIYSDEELCDYYGVEPVIKINSRIIYDYWEQEKIAINDGFESMRQFCHWFNKDFMGKIIHWTDLKY